MQNSCFEMQNSPVAVPSEGAAANSLVASGMPSSEDGMTLFAFDGAFAVPSEGAARLARLDLEPDLKERRKYARQHIRCLTKHGAVCPAESRIYGIMLVFYQDSTPFDLVETWVGNLRGRSECKLAGAFHNRDLADDGNPLKEHLHLAFRSNSARTPSAWCKWLADTECPLSVMTVYLWDDTNMMFRYLLHKGFPKKHQYDYDALMPWSDDMHPFIGEVGAAGGVSELGVFLQALSEASFYCLLDVVNWCAGTFMEAWVCRHYGLIERCIRDWLIDHSSGLIVDSEETAEVS